MLSLTGPLHGSFAAALPGKSNRGNPTLMGLLHGVVVSGMCVCVSHRLARVHVSSDSHDSRTSHQHQPFLSSPKAEIRAGKTRQRTIWVEARDETLRWRKQRVEAIGPDPRDGVYSYYLTLPHLTGHVIC